MYRKKRKYPIRKIVLISLIVITLILGLITNIVKTDRELTSFEKAIKDGVLTINKIISYPFDWIVDKINDNNKKQEVLDKCKDNQKELEQLKKLKYENEELKLQLEEMKKALELNTILGEYKTLNATVIGRDLSYWNDTIIIDKGEYSGVQKGMPVVVSEGLIGKVVSTTTFTSTVRLMTANNTHDKISVKVKIGNKYAYGILSSYSKKTDTYIVEGISQNIEIKQDLVVTTTGMGDIFPSGIVVGKITGVTTDTFDLAKVLEIKSEVNFDNLNYVTVLKRGNEWLFLLVYFLSYLMEFYQNI